MPAETFQYSSLKGLLCCCVSLECPWFHTSDGFEWQPRALKVLVLHRWPHLSPMSWHWHKWVHLVGDVCSLAACSWLTWRIRTPREEVFAASSAMASCLRRWIVCSLGLAVHPGAHQGDAVRDIKNAECFSGYRFFLLRHLGVARCCWRGCLVLAFAQVHALPQPAQCGAAGCLVWS